MRKVQESRASREERKEMASAVIPSENTRDDDSLRTRETLLARMKGGDGDRDRAWEEFFEQYWRLIHNVARKAGLDEEDARDLVQEVMANLSEALPRFQPDPRRARFKTWLLTIVHRRIIDHRRRQQNRPEPFLGTGDEELAVAPELEQIWDAEWNRHQLDTALRRVRGKVAAKQFLIYDMLVCQGAGVRDVCRALGINAATVYLARHRVGSLVRQELRGLRDA